MYAISWFRSTNIEEAIDKMRWHQHSHQAIFGRTPRKEGKQLSPGPHHEGEARVCVIGAEKSLEKKMGEVLSAQGKEMSDIKANIYPLEIIRLFLLLYVQYGR
jgi:hypothetical protein